MTHNTIERAFYSILALWSSSVIFLKACCKSQNHEDMQREKFWIYYHLVWNKQPRNKQEINDFNLKRPYNITSLYKLISMLIKISVLLFCFMLYCDEPLVGKLAWGSEIHFISFYFVLKYGEFHGFVEACHLIIVVLKISEKSLCIFNLRLFELVLNFFLLTCKEDLSQFSYI